MSDSNLPPLWVDAIRLFNDGDYFACHDAIEELWYATPEEDRLPGSDAAAPSAKRFLQGVLQMSVALVHLRRGNPRGVRTVYASGLEKLKNSPASAMGIDVRGFLLDMNRVIDPILKLPEKRFNPGRPRDDDMPWDETSPPRIRLLSGV